MGILIEHFAGSFPTWLSPVQVKILPISDKVHSYALGVEKELIEAGIRVETDLRSETLQAKIRDAQLIKVPYMLIVGDKEEKNQTVSERGRSGKDYGEHKVEEFIQNIKSEIEEKVIN
jgi:threonyl-tRNA synthetase